MKEPTYAEFVREREARAWEACRCNGQPHDLECPAWEVLWEEPPVEDTDPSSLR